MSKFNEIAPKIWTGIATDAEMAAIGIADVVAIKSDGEHVRYRPCTRGAISVDTDKRQILDVASDETTDRVGDVIAVKGWDLAPFKHNPILQRWHLGDRLPVGIVPQIRKGKQDDGRPALLALSQFFEDEDLDEEGRLMSRLALKKLMPARSVGFLPRKTVRPDDPKERAKLGIGDWGVYVEECELLELSVVNVGCNPNALGKALDEEVAAGRITKSLAAQAMADLTSERSPTRTVVPVAKIDQTEGAVPVPSAFTVTLNANPFGLRYIGEDADLATRGGLLPGTFVVPGVRSDLDVSLDTRLASIEAKVDALTHTLSAELPALKATLEALTRGAAAPSSSPVDTQEPEKSPDTEARSAPDAATFLSEALDAIDKGVEARSRPKGGH